MSQSYFIHLFNPFIWSIYLFVNIRSFSGDIMLQISHIFPLILSTDSWHGFSNLSYNYKQYITHLIMRLTKLFYNKLDLWSSCVTCRAFGPPFGIQLIKSFWNWNSYQPIVMFCHILYFHSYMCSFHSIANIVSFLKRGHRFVYTD